jgi:hypothetical protein
MRINNGGYGIGRIVKSIDKFKQKNRNNANDK